jgi:nitroimidazol reductase NimA-like FMN-containing flavoprotein (pyridoxamine 5'-phosphate oxidase superfamily)/RimJ/RimL family protein N-acetyltransferase
MTSFPITARTTATRNREKMRYDREQAYAILDEAWHCTLSFVADGEPRALPTLIVRIGDTAYVHGSTGSHPLLKAAKEEGLKVCLTVTHFDGLVLARSQFHHAANYRSLVAHGIAVAVTGEAEKRSMLTALVEKVAEGRSQETRPPSVKELAQTTVLKLALEEVSVRVRTGGVNDEEEDLGLPYWAGVIPTPVHKGLPVAEPHVEVRLPENLGVSRWLEPVTLRGEHVILEPLTLAHTGELFAALGQDEEIWRYTTTKTPQDLAAMREYVDIAMQTRATGQRVPFLQRDARTGEAIGTTSLFPEERNRSLEIGATLLARKAWRTGVNTEAKLMLLEHCFGNLKAGRVCWQTDVLNLRSQQAIERLGAQREGTLRANRKRADGSPRDSAIYSIVASEWPNAHSALRARLEQD